MKREKFTLLQKNYTATGSDGSDKSYLCVERRNFFRDQLFVFVWNYDTVMLNNIVTINRYDKQSADQLYTGDEILSVNGMALQGMSHR